MTDRSVSVRLRAQVTDFRAGMASAGRSVDELQHKLADSDAKTKARTQQVSRGMLLIGAAGVAAAGAAVMAFAKFDKTMSNVKAVSNATAGEMDQLRDAAIEAGKATVFSASESAQAEAELAKAGVSTADILGGALTGSLNLASSGQLELADAATIAAQAMNIFKLQGADVSHIADVLAAGANKSAADVKGLGDALRQGGLVAAQTGLDLEDTVGTLSAFADNALIGSDAGTSLKTMLQRLTPQSKDASDAMASIGFSAYDAQGNFIGLEAVAQNLQKGLGGLSDEQRNATLSTIFGSDAVRAASILYDQGAAGIKSYTDAVNDQGAASRMAATQLDNLAGDVEQLKGSLETALIQSGSGANGTLRTLTQTATGAVNTFADLPGPVQATATAIVGVGGAALTALGGIGYLLPKVQEGRKGLRDLGTAGAFADRGLGKLGKAGLYGAGLLAFGETVQFLSDKLTDLEGKSAPSVDSLTNSLVKFAKTGEIAGAAMQGIGEDAGQLNDDLGTLDQFGAGVGLFFNRTSFGTFGRDLDQARDRVDALDKSLAGLVEGGHADVAAQVLKNLAAAGVDVGALRPKLNDYADALTDADTAAELAAGSTGDFADSADQVSPVVEEATDAIDDYKTALDNLNGVNITAARAQLELGQAYHDANKAKEKGKKVTDDETSALLDLADQANSTASAVLDQTGSQDKANGVLKEARQRFFDTARAMGYTKGEAAKLRDAWLQIPTKRNTKYTTSGVDAAVSEIDRIRAAIRSLPSNPNLNVSVNAANKVAANDELSGARASGGPVSAGRLYRVNELGMEFFRPAVSGTIIPAGQTAALMSGTTPVKATPAVGGQTTAATGGGYAGVALNVTNYTEPMTEFLPRVLDEQMWKVNG